MRTITKALGIRALTIALVAPLGCAGYSNGTGPGRQGGPLRALFDLCVMEGKARDYCEPWAIVEMAKINSQSPPPSVVINPLPLPLPLR